MQADNTEVTTAFAKALAEVEVVRKKGSADTGKYTYTYADLVDVLAEVKRVCQGFGLAISQVVGQRDGMLTVTTSLYSTTDGSAMTFDPIELAMPRDPQALGSATTYLRRYSLVAIFAMPVADDDGAEATKQARATAQGHGRTGAEDRIREIIGSMADDVRAQFVADFKAQFGTGLTDLVSSRHADALTWTLAWMRPPAAEPTEPEAPPELDTRTPDQVADDAEATS